MARKRKTPPAGGEQVSEYRYADDTRKNNPPAGLAAHGQVRPAPKLRYAYDPHLPPVLRFDATGRAQYFDDLIERAIGGQLSDENGALLRELLGGGEPWLEWAGKRETPGFVVDPVALHIHERVSTQAILSVLRRSDVQRDLFADPQQELHDAVRFYQYDVPWANRMILGDSLQVMASLAHREDLAGKVQMIYMDPPYGIRFASNFQPEIGRRDVKDKDQDLTREPEMVKAYRDTWTLGVHSYLSYLRERLILCRELLADSGSIFVQISDENLHRVRSLLDEVFGSDNFQATIVYRTSVPLKSTGLASIADYLVWYAKDREKMKRHDLFEERDAGEGGIYVGVEEASGHRRTMNPAERRDPKRAKVRGRVFGTDNLVSSGYTPTCIFPIEFEGTSYQPTSRKSWKTNQEGVARLIAAGRLSASGKTLRAMMYIDDYPVKKLTNLWTDTKGETDKQFVVQTASKVIQRCLLMTTDPGDLVVDPTCGSGTTAYVAEQWGRRWITIDTSRVALALARQRLMTATLPHYVVDGDDASDGRANPARGFICNTVPHITLKTIAQNVALDPIFEKHQTPLDGRLADLNAALKSVPSDIRGRLKRKLAEKQKQEGKRVITVGDRRRWLLPETQWREWEVPFDTDEDWPMALRDALVAYRNAWRAKMDEVNAMISASAEQEQLVDQPRVERGVIRVAGPFTMEAVMPLEQSDDPPDGESGSTERPAPAFGGEPEDDLETFDEIGAGADAVNAGVFVDNILHLLGVDGVRFPDNRQMKFTRLDRIEGAVALHGEGEWQNGEGAQRDVVISIGPQHGPVTAYQVEDALREANRRGADDIVFAGFSFDGAAQAAIQDDPHPRVRAHLAHIAPDVQMGGLLKATSDSQLFSVFGLPRAELHSVGGEEWTVEMQGVDIYDPVRNTIHATRADKVAAWFVDSDYDGRTFCIAQAFFPDRSAWKKLERALRGTIDPEQFDALSGTTSLPFRPGRHRRVGVKVIDPRGNEVMRVMRIPS